MKNVGDVCTTVTAKYGTGGGNVPIVVPDVSKTLSCPKGFRLDYETETFIPTVAVQTGMTGANGKNWSEEVSHTLDTANPPVVNQSYGEDLRVRRLTPMECERLQGFPDDYTKVPYMHYKETPDTPRYKAIGNSFAVPVVRDIGRRIDVVDRIING